MGAYDSSQFSKMFSERTEANLTLLSSFVERNNTAAKTGSDVLSRIESIIEDLKDLEDGIAAEISNVSSSKKKGHAEVRGVLYSTKSKIEQEKKKLEEKKKALEKTVDSINCSNVELYEVTQLLNSLMGIAVLPFEMHKGILKKSRQPSNDLLMETPESKHLGLFIMSLHENGKWVSSYSSDRRILEQKEVSATRIVPSFLSHIRNTVCHSGDDALSILPLSEGRVIEEVLFYDNCPAFAGGNSKEEFAMKLTIDELREMVKLIAGFYKFSMLGRIDKTEEIKHAEEHVNTLLRAGQKRSGR